MNNNITQTDGKSYINIDDWYIGIHLDINGDLLVFIDHKDGKVVDYNEVITEDEFQWGKAFYVSKTHRPANPLPIRKTLRNTIKVEVTR